MHYETLEISYEIAHAAFICSKLTIETLEQGVNFEHLTPYSIISIVISEHVIAYWKLLLISASFNSAIVCAYLQCVMAYCECLFSISLHLR